MTLIHLQDMTIGYIKPACGSTQPQGGVTLQQFNQQLTGEPRAVNCNACKNTEIFKSAMQRISK